MRMNTVGTDGDGMKSVGMRADGDKLCGGQV